MSRPERTAFTAYYALSDMTPNAARDWLQCAPLEDLIQVASRDLRLAYGWRLPMCVDQRRNHGPRPRYGRTAARVPFFARTARFARFSRTYILCAFRSVGDVSVRGSGVVGVSGGDADCAST
jgi:hypothetical protein